MCHLLTQLERKRERRKNDSLLVRVLNRSGCGDSGVGWEVVPDEEEISDCKESGSDYRRLRGG